MKKNYQVVSRSDRRALARWLTKNGQGLLPLVELVESTELALEELRASQSIFRSTNRATRRGKE